MPNPLFTAEDEFSPVYCTGCRAHVPRAVATANDGLCGDCVAANGTDPELNPPAGHYADSDAQLMAATDRQEHGALGPAAQSKAAPGTLWRPLIFGLLIVGIGLAAYEMGRRVRPAEPAAVVARPDSMGKPEPRVTPPTGRPRAGSPPAAPSLPAPVSVEAVPVAQDPQAPGALPAQQPGDRPIATGGPSIVNRLMLDVDEMTVSLREDQLRRECAEQRKAMRPVGAIQSIQNRNAIATAEMRFREAESALANLQKQGRKVVDMVPGPDGQGRVLHNPGCRLEAIGAVARLLGALPERQTGYTWCSSCGPR